MERAWRGDVRRGKRNVVSYSVFVFREKPTNSIDSFQCQRRPLWCISCSPLRLAGIRRTRSLLSRKGKTERTLGRGRNQRRDLAFQQRARFEAEKKHRWSCAAGVFFVIPASPRFNLPHTWIWWMIIGRFANSTMGLGTVSVSGRRRVPKPPTRIRARTMFFSRGIGVGRRSLREKLGGCLERVSALRAEDKGG